VLKRFEGKVIAIAGGAGGIGTAVSHRVADEGAAVIVGDINFLDAQVVAAEINDSGGRAIPFELNIGDEANVIAFIDAAVATYGGLDGFHANASDSSRRDDDADITSMDMATYDHMMDVNTRGFFLCARHSVPRLVERGGGSLLFTSSGAAYMGETPRPVYAMGKNAVHGLSRYIANRWGKQGVRSNVISPGLIMHPAVLSTMGVNFVEEVLKGVKAPRLGEPRDIAAMAALLLSEEGAYVTGQVICVDGGATMRP
jgi:NAD(P)-dependent dehydrogenase (short-subunit alcohol dehydrogenase family)